MKKQAHYTLGTPIKGSAQAAGFLREDLRALDHEELYVCLILEILFFEFVEIILFFDLLLIKLFAFLFLEV